MAVSHTAEMAVNSRNNLKTHRVSTAFCIQINKDLNSLEPHDIGWNKVNRENNLSC